MNFSIFLSLGALILCAPHIPALGAIVVAGAMLILNTIILSRRQ